MSSFNITPLHVSRFPKWSISSQNLLNSVTTVKSYQCKTHFKNRSLLWENRIPIKFNTEVTFICILQERSQLNPISGHYYYYYYFYADRTWGRGAEVSAVLVRTRQFTSLKRTAHPCPLDIAAELATVHTLLHKVFCTARLLAVDFAKCDVEQQSTNFSGSSSDPDGETPDSQVRRRAQNYHPLMVLTEIRLSLFLFYVHSCVAQHMTGSVVANAGREDSVTSVPKHHTTELRNMVQRCVRCYQVRILAGTSAILTEVFPGFPRKCRENASIRQNNLKFVIYQLSYNGHRLEIKHDHKSRHKTDQGYEGKAVHILKCA